MWVLWPMWAPWPDGRLNARLPAQQPGALVPLSRPARPRRFQYAAFGSIAQQTPHYGQMQLCLQGQLGSACTTK